ncbi:MAG: 5-formyltetrahydrofolate cyclo-ligase [Jatrophihabitantaceae bacterium]
MTDKADLRATIAAARVSLTDGEREHARAAIRQLVLTHCAAIGLAAGSVIAGYQPLRTEPGSLSLLAELDRAGYRVIVPVTLADRDLDWTWWPAPEAEVGAAPELLGLAAIGEASLILVPAFAVDRFGNRLGRGGGSYDRALGRVQPGTPVAALLYDGELVERVPTEAWDRPVGLAATPSGLIELTPSGRRNTR